jgi:hypothetical protein
MIEVPGGIPAMHVEEAILFAFDEVSLPFRRNLVTHLTPSKSRGRLRIVLPKGPPESHDESLHSCGTTIRIGDEYRIWHIGRIFFKAPRVDASCKEP